MDRRSLLLAFIVIATAILWHLARSPENAPATAESTRSTDLGASKPEATSAAAAGVDTPDCLTPAQLESHPMMMREFARIESVMVSGPTFESYRNLTRSDLIGLAGQRDSAAMVVLGAMAELRARNVDESQAVDLLNFTDPELNSFRYQRPLPEPVQAEYQRAAHWYYEAALHGRLQALYRYGSSLEMAVGGAVDLEWLTEQEYTDLTATEQIWFTPSNAYGQLQYELLPASEIGILETGIDYHWRRSERWQLLMMQLANQYRADLGALELELITVPPSELPAREVLQNMVCPEWRPDGSGAQ